MLLEPTPTRAPTTFEMGNKSSEALRDAASETYNVDELLEYEPQEEEPRTAFFHIVAGCPHPSPKPLSPLTRADSR